jgi:DNA (cytosine-5)-methyltransferase 1
VAPLSAPRLLDLFCGAGGAAAGYARAGFAVTGVDRLRQRHYPFAFVRGDALDYLAAHGREYDLIHASPPCQRYSATGSLPGAHPDWHDDLVGPVRALLVASGVPYIIENVPGAPLRAPVLLCGTMFAGLRVIRHRLFESGLPLAAPPHPAHTERILRRPYAVRLTSYGGQPGDMVTVAGHQFSRASGSAAMGIDWMQRHELAQAVPPAYTEHLGRQALALLGGCA